MDELISELKLLSEKTSLTEREITKANKLVVSVEEIVESAKQQVEGEKSRTYQSVIEARELAKEAARGIYIENATEAATESEEYAYNSFLSPLLEVADDEDLYQYTLVGNGWGTKLQVHLDMDGVAGTIDDYAEAVESARGALGVNDNRDPVRASKIWRDKIYQGPRYFTTINLRLAAATGKAPFWSLLNNGNNTVMDSDIGGRAYPKVKATRFVQKTEAAISNEFSFQLLQLRDRINVIINDLVAMILTAESILGKINLLVNKISIEPTLMDKVAKELGVEVSTLSATKLYRARDKLLNGQYVADQISVQAAGQKRRRVRRATLTSLLLDLGD